MAKMPPPERGAAVMIAIGKPKEKTPPPGWTPPDALPEEPDEPKKDANGKVSPDDATVIREDEHCIDCKNYHPDTGECDKISGSFSPQDACVKYFTPLEEKEEEPDEDEAGGPPDNDADDQGEMPA